MSLSFVSSTVQTGTADGGFEEVAIESKEKEAVNRQNEHKPLFEQLRQNQEEDDAKREEMQNEMMRGTCALDEDDVAHLDALNKQKQERERVIALRTRDELAMFRAARAERQQIHLEEEEEDDKNENNDKTKKKSEEKKEPKKKKSAPKIIVKKRKPKGASLPQKKAKPEKTPALDKDKESTTTSGLGGLLCGYGSSGDDSEQ